MPIRKIEFVGVAKLLAVCDPLFSSVAELGSAARSPVGKFAPLLPVLLDVDLLGYLDVGMIAELVQEGDISI